MIHTRRGGASVNRGSREGFDMGPHLALLVKLMTLATLLAVGIVTLGIAAFIVLLIAVIREMNA